MNYEAAEAHRILDLVKAGDDSIDEGLILWCLLVTGDLIGNRL